jgi:hypothetical protein
MLHHWNLGAVGYKETSEAEPEKGFENGNDCYPHEMGGRNKSFYYEKPLYLPQ